MSTKLLPSPDDDAPSSSTPPKSAKGGPESRRRKRPQGQDRIPTADDCLRLLNRLGGMVALGLMTPSQAGVLRSIYQTILQHHQRRDAAAPQQSLGGAEFMAKLRDDPDLVNMLAPFLTNDQLAELLGEGGGSDESV